jgi:hypothetical protein
MTVARFSTKLVQMPLTYLDCRDLSELFVMRAINTAKACNNTSDIWNNWAQGWQDARRNIDEAREAELDSRMNHVPAECACRAALAYFDTIDKMVMLDSTAFWLVETSSQAAIYGKTPPRHLNELQEIAKKEMILKAEVKAWKQILNDASKMPSIMASIPA